MQSDLVKALGIVDELVGDDSLSTDNVVNRISDKSGVSGEEIFGDSRRASVVYLRQGAYYVFREKFGWGYAKIGHLMSRHHTTIMSGVKRIKKGFNRYNGRFLIR